MIRLCLGALALALLPIEAGATTAFLSGNSVTDEVKYAALSSLASSQGLTLTIGRHSIPGSSIKFRWQNPTSGFTTSPFGTFPSAAANYDWDALVLQPFDSLLPDDVTYGGLHISALDVRPANRDTAVYIYARYPKKRTLSYTDQWNVPYAPGDFTTVDGKDFFDQLRAAWAANHPGHPIRIIPVGHVFHELDVRMRAGLIPGYDSIYDVYTWSVNSSDKVHVEDTGSYIIACTFFATLLGVSPVGLPFGDYPGVTPAFAAAVQDAVWDVVTTTPHTGVTAAPGPVEITTLLLPPGLVGQFYQFQMQASQGSQPYTWSLTGGTLPDGLTFSTTGLLSGVPSEATSVDLTISVTGGTVAQRTLRLNLDSDTSPTISIQTLPEGKVGRLYVHSLQATGGNGALIWSLDSGTLPPGLELGADGSLVGTPRTGGFFSLTARVTDSDAVGADSDTRVVDLRIGIPDDEALVVTQASTPIVINGVADEPGWRLSQPIVRLAEGTVDGAARFGALWDSQALFLAIEVTDSVVRSDSPDPWQDDSLEIFIDANHDREEVYNADDRRLTFRRDGSLSGVGQLTGITRAVAVSGDLWVLEVRIPWSNLGIAPVDGLTLGLDVAVNDDDSGGDRDGRSFWRGNSQADLVPKFGAAILQSGPRSGHLESGGLLVVEAEDYATETPASDGTTRWALVTTPAGAAGTGAMRTPDVGFTTANFAGGAVLTYPVTITQAGDYTVWLRRIGPDGDSNSAFLGRDGVQISDVTVDNGAFASTWSWFKLTQRVAFGAGAHSLELRHREDGYGVDRLLLALDPAYNPATIAGGVGPAKSDFQAAAAGGYAAWASSFVWTEAQADRAADPDRDGRANFLEYAFFADPILKDSAASPRADYSPGRVTLIYRAGRPELVYRPEWTADFVTWNTTGIQVETTPASPIVSASVEFDPVTRPRVFLRVVVSEG